MYPQRAEDSSEHHDAAGDQPPGVHRAGRPYLRHRNCPGQDQWRAAGDVGDGGRAVRGEGES